MNKVKSLTLIALTLSLVSCGGNESSVTTTTQVAPKDIVSDFLTSARKGFELTAKSDNNVFNKFTGEKIFTNTKTYHHYYDSLNRDQVIQEVSYPSDGKMKTDTVRFVKDDEGFLAKEYINYKNDVDIYRFGEELGTRYVYDELFMNPFKMIFKEDLVKDEKDESVYHLTKSKCSRFENYLIGTGKPTESVTFDFDEDGIPTIDIKSVELNGKAKLEDKTYVAATWHFADHINLLNIGETHIEPLVTSKGVAPEDLKNAFAKVKDNYTLKTELSVNGQPASPKTTQVLKVTKDAILVDATKEEGKEAGDRLFQKDEFASDDLFYEFMKKDGNWEKVPCVYEGAYNIDPQGLDYFIPHISEINPVLFTYDLTSKAYKVNNPYAITNMGNGFLADYNRSIYFDYGYGLDVSVTLNNNNINVKLDFIAAVEGAAYQMAYNLTYSDIGTTVISEK